MKKKSPSRQIPIPQDLPGCQALIRELFATIAQQQETVVEQARLLIEKQARIEQLVQEKFTRRSERYKADPNQLVLDFPGTPGIESIAEGLADAVVEEVEASEVAEHPAVPATRPRRSRQRRQENLPEGLPRREVVVEVPESVRCCPTHGERVRIGEDVTETLVFVPAELYVERRVFPKYACANHAECGVGSPARPASLIEGNRYDTSIAAEIITAKYGFHLPVYRQQDLFAASGWAPARETLLNIMRSAAELLPPFIGHLKQRLLATRHLGTDDTTLTLLLPRNLPALDPDNPRSARIHEVLQAAREAGHPSVTARMWAYRSIAEKLNIFDFTVSRHRDGPDQFLLDTGYEGTLISDCYSGYVTLDERSATRILHAACNAHARRKFFNAQANHPQLGALFLGMYRELYDIEQQGRSWEPAARLALRRERGVPVWERMRALLEGPLVKKLAPKDKMREATEYLRKHWNALRVYLDDPLVPIDNNDVEQLMKQVAVGRKNWLFAGSVAAGEQAAMLMTLTSSALRNDLHVGMYLKAVLDALLAGSTDYAALAPDVWARQHPEAIRRYRQEERQERATAKEARREERLGPSPAGAGESSGEHAVPG